MSVSLEKSDKYQQITNKIIQGLEEVQPGQWKCPWHKIGAVGLPLNGVTKKEYRGINWLLLSIASEETGCGTFASYKQWKTKGRQVKKGSTGFPVTFFKTLKVEESTKEGTVEKDIAMMRFSTVFCESQLEDYEPKETKARPNKVEFSESVENLVQSLSVDLRTENRNQAFYRSDLDFINMPPKEQFAGTPTSSATESYYSTLLHELTHWTGHKTRCDRKLRNHFGSKDYAKEELVAELGSAFLSQQYNVSLELRPDHIQYLKSWLQCLKDDKKFIFKAAALSQKATDFIKTNAMEVA